MTQLFANNAASTLASGITNSATSLTLATGEGAKFPSPSGGDFFKLTLTQRRGLAETSWEICYCTARSGDTLTVTRGQDGTTAAEWSADDKVELRLTKADVEAMWAGKQTIWIPAGAMAARTTSGAASGTVETTTNKVMVKTLDFDQSTAEYAQFAVQMPKSWNKGTVSAQFVWSSNISGTNSVVWGCQALALSDDDALDTAFGTAQTVTDAQTAQGDLMRSAETSAITVGNTPAESDVVVFQVYRDAASGSDTLAGDARLHGVVIFYTTAAANDA